MNNSGTEVHPLEVIAASCSAGSCPTVYRTGRGTAVVQGYAVTPADAGIDVPAGELLVEVPLELLASAIARHPN